MVLQADAKLSAVAAITFCCSVESWSLTTSVSTWFTPTKNSQIWLHHNLLQNKDAAFLFWSQFLPSLKRRMLDAYSFLRKGLPCDIFGESLSSLSAFKTAAPALGVQRSHENLSPLTPDPYFPKSDRIVYAWVHLSFPLDTSSIGSRMGGVIGSPIEYLQRNHYCCWLI